MLDTQLSVRFSTNQRRYLQEQLRQLRTDPTLRHFRWSESDLVRALINEAMRASRQIVPTQESEQ
ncbi:hypothetical protein P9A51_gp79 [Xanthomonas phage Xp12]|uniref:Uncharacterized protein n=1 Tax=Xanthomonas phage Xp12 TaxID=2746072 RepID=A0A7G9UT79_9CAUD|nr:hypothetical protein P9A51_gp79 [Xanthomonas phage Xp12]QNN97234.1 hypothetical protein [Xanthomonas phage Xp12]